MENLTEGKITLKKLKKGYVVHLSQSLGFCEELALTEKELLVLGKLIEREICLLTKDNTSVRVR